MHIHTQASIHKHAHTYTAAHHTHTYTQAHIHSTPAHPHTTHSENQTKQKYLITLMIHEPGYVIVHVSQSRYNHILWTYDEKQVLLGHTLCKKHPQTSSQKMTGWLSFGQNVLIWKKKDTGKQKWKSHQKKEKKNKRFGRNKNITNKNPIWKQYQILQVTKWTWIHLNQDPPLMLATPCNFKLLVESNLCYVSFLHVHNSFKCHFLALQKGLPPPKFTCCVLS